MKDNVDSVPPSGEHHYNEFHTAVIVLYTPG